MTFAHPETSGIILSKLLLANAFTVLERARGVKVTVNGLLDELERASAADVSDAVASHSQSFTNLLHLGERDGITATTTTAFATTDTTQRGELTLSAALVKPRAHVRRLRAIRVDFNQSATDSTNVLALKVADARVLDCHDGIFTTRNQVFNLATHIDGVRTPERELDGRVRVVANHDGTLLSLRSITLENRLQVTDAVRDTDDVNHRSLVQIANLSNLLERVLDLVNFRFPFRALFKRRVLVNLNLVLVDGISRVTRRAHLSLGDFIHDTLSQLFRESHGDVAKAHSLNLSTLVVEQLETEHLAFAARVAVRSQLEVVCDSRANRPARRVRVEITNLTDSARSLISRHRSALRAILLLLRRRAAAVPAARRRRVLLLLLLLLLTVLTASVPLILRLRSRPIRISLLHSLTTDTRARRPTRRVHSRLTHDTGRPFEHIRLHDNQHPAYDDAIHARVSHRVHQMKQNFLHAFSKPHAPNARVKTRHHGRKCIRKCVSDARREDEKNENGSEKSRDSTHFFPLTSCTT